VSLWRIRPGEVVTGVAGLVLLGSLFLDWYEAGASRAGATRESGLSAWGAFAVVDVLLLGTALAALAVTVLTAYRAQAVAVTVTSLTTPLAVLATTFVLVRLAFPPGSAGEGGRELGVYLGVLP
jgi:hypothetical protein